MQEGEVAPLDERGAANSYRMFLSVQPDGDVISAAAAQFGAWLRAKKNWDPPLDRNERQQNGDRDLITLHRESSDGREFRARLTETTLSGLWRTQLTVHVPNRSSLPWISLQVANSEGHWTAVPWLATYLLDSLTTRDGATIVSSKSRVVRPDQVEDFLAEICDGDRQGLIFAAGTARTDIPFDPFADQVGKWVQQTRGLAQTVVLTPEATDEVGRALGPDHAPRPWTLRTYYPGVDPAVRADGLRHKYVTTDRLANESFESIRKLLGRVARRHAALRTPPVEYVRVDRALRRLEDQVLVDSISVLLPASRQDETQAEVGVTDFVAPDTVEELVATAEASPGTEVASTATETDLQGTDDRLGQSTRFDGSSTYAAVIESVKETFELAEASPESIARIGLRLRNAESAARAIDQVRGQLKEIQSQLKEREDQLSDAQDSATYYSGLYEEAALEERITAIEARKLESENRWLRTQLAQLGDRNAYAQVPEDAYIRSPENFDELLSLLPELADRGVIFTGDQKEMLSLHEYDSLGKLAANAWDAFLVLADYIRARKEGVCEGGVRQYLEKTPQGYRTISQKKFAAKETAATMQAWGDLREFPVPIDIDPSGFKTMEAHFKLGHVGMVSPRMYYLDCWNAHGKVCVGYVGAHLRNTQTN